MLIKFNYEKLNKTWVRRYTCKTFIRGVSRRPSSSNGLKILRSRRGSRLINRVRVSNSYRFGEIMFVSNIFFTPNIFKVVMRVSSQKGECFIMPGVENVKLFSYYFFNKYYLFDPKSNVSFFQDMQIFKMKHNSIVSNIGQCIKSKRKYIKSAGTKGRILSLNAKKKIALIKLPSSEIRTFSLFGYCMPGANLLPLKKKIIKGNYKYKRLRGYSSVVRGIAMNPIDHPHGGKKKSVRFPRNPWGLGAKKK